MILPHASAASFGHEPRRNLVEMPKIRIHPCSAKSPPLPSSTHTGLNDDAATVETKSPAGGWGSVSEFAIAMRDKILECAGASAEDRMLPLVAVGAAAALLAAFTLYVLSRYFDRDPFLFNGGKMGKLEAQSIYTANKKQC